MRPGADPDNHRADDCYTHAGEQYPVPDLIWAERCLLIYQDPNPCEGPGRNARDHCVGEC
jgi:hypothetical protein